MRNGSLQVCIRLDLVIALSFLVGCSDGLGSATDLEQRSVLSEAEPIAMQGEKDKSENWDSRGESTSPERQIEPRPHRPEYLFDEEVKALARAAGCSGMKRTAAAGGFGALAGCIEGGAETAKLFVNGVAGTKVVENVKVMWNDWFKDTGYGLHPDRAEAEKLLDAVVKRYAPTRLDEIKRAFFNRQALSEDHEGFRIAVTHDKGPAIEEHLLIVTFHGR